MSDRNADKYAYVAPLAEIADNDFNLNIPRYVDTFEEEAEVDVAAMQREIDQLEQGTDRSARAHARAPEGAGGGGMTGKK